MPSGPQQHQGHAKSEIRKLDVFEVSATPAPMNPGTRVLSTKALVDDEPNDRVPSDAELRWEYALLTDPGVTEALNRSREDMVRILTAPSDAEEKRREREVKAAAPIQVATFEC